jgi:putative ABC transport system permease protein
MAAGQEPPEPGEIIIDGQVAERLGVGVGDTVSALGHQARIAGLASGTANVVSSVAFVDRATFRQAARTRSGASYLLVWPADGIDAGDAAEAIERDYPVTAQTREEFSVAERAIISDMSTGLIRGMLVIGFVVGVAVAALSMYTVTTSRLREYAVLKAIGLRNRGLYGMVARQATLTVGGGLALALGLLAAMTVVIPAVEPSLTMAVTAGSLLRVIAITGVIAVVAALLPALRLARVDPASVYRS